MLKTGIKLLGFGRAVPKRRVTNDDLAQYVETSDEWIRERVGIGSRYYVGEGENCVTLAAEAAQKAVKDSGVNPDTIGIILVGTFSASQSIPNCASLVQASLGLQEQPLLAYDINAACSGFVFGVATARALLATMPGKVAVVIGVETISPLLDMNDRNTCVLFGDGAGAVVLGLDPHKGYAQVLDSRGDVEGFLTAPGSSSREGFVAMHGREIYRFAMRVVPQTVRLLAEEADLNPEDFDWIVCHQANERIIDGVAKRLELPVERFYKDLEEYGNTSAATIPIALADMHAEKLLKEGQKIALLGFGGGLTWGGIYLEY